MPASGTSSSNDTDFPGMASFPVSVFTVTDVFSVPAVTGPYYGSADVALITPPLKLESGKTYKISCLSWVDEVEEDDGYGWGGSIIEPDPKDLGFIVGTEPSLTNMETISTANINKGEADKISADAFFSPSANGSYYFGFRCNTTRNGVISGECLYGDRRVLCTCRVSDDRDFSYFRKAYSCICLVGYRKGYHSLVGTLVIWNE